MLLPVDLMRKIDGLAVASRRPFAGRIRGEHRSLRKGASLEFADHRNYMAGDDIRFIDWKVFARLDKLFLKRFMDEEDLTLHLLLDRSLSMGLDAKLKMAKQLSAALAYLALGAGHRVVVQPFGEDLGPPASFRGRGGYALLERFVEAIGPEGKTAMGTGFARFRREGVGSGVAVIFSDLFDRAGMLDALKPLVTPRFEISVLHLLSREEEEPEFDGDWRLVDVEDGMEVAVSMGRRLRDSYTRTVRRFRGEQQTLCSRYGFKYVPLRSDFPLETVMLHHLRRRGVVE